MRGVWGRRGRNAILSTNQGGKIKKGFRRPPKDLNLKVKKKNRRGRRSAEPRKIIRKKRLTSRPDVLGKSHYNLLRLRNFLKQ